MKDLLLRYFYLKKKDPNAPKSINIFLMHGMNRISIFMFVIALIIMIVRAIVRN
jgi:hypothetical protein